MDTILNFFKIIWEALVKYYGIYSDFIHSIFPRELGDLVVIILDLVIAFGLIKIVAAYAFKSN